MLLQEIHDLNLYNSELMQERKHIIDLNETLKENINTQNYKNILLETKLENLKIKNETLNMQIKNQI